MPTDVTFIGHGSFLFSIGGKSLIVDPFFTGNPAATMSADKVSPDVIVISHGHGDHVGDTVSIAQRTGCLVVSNFEICTWLREKHGLSRLHELNTGGGTVQKIGDQQVHIRFTIAHHSSSLPDGTYGGNPCGVLLKLPGGTVYHACDTAVFSEMQFIGDEGIDLAILPIGDNYTMGPDDALRAVKLIRPKRVIPDHYNTWPVIAQDAAAWAARVKAETTIEPIVLKPGQTVKLG